MDIATIIVLIALLLMVLAYVGQPFLAGGGRAERAAGPSRDALRRRADLLAERNRIYQAINTLDFDHTTHKVADADWDTQRHALVAQGVELLKQIDTLPKPAADPVESAVRALRSGGLAASPPAAKPASSRRGKARSKPRPQALTCPHCGRPIEPGDQFCASCGNRL